MNKSLRKENDNCGAKDRTDILRKVRNGELTVPECQMELKRIKRKIKSKPTEVWCSNKSPDEKC